MQKDRRRWNERYRNQQFSSDPSAIVKQYYTLAQTGRALDIATGTGRNAIYLAHKGFTVEAVDISEVALRDITLRHTNLHPLCADLDYFEIPESRYTLILNIRYLNRRLFPQIQEGLIRGGILIFETYMDPPPDADPGAFCRDYLLRPNELLHAFLPLNILYYAEQVSEETDDTRRVASLVAVKKE